MNTADVERVEYRQRFYNSIPGQPVVWGKARPSVRFWQRRRANQDEEQLPDAAANQQTQAAAWVAIFPGDTSQQAYEAGFRTHTPLSWELVQSSQGDLLRMLVNRVPADIGVPVVLGLSVLYGEHSKADQASQSLLATMVREMEPQRARTMLVTLATAWQSAESASFDSRAALIQTEMLRALRRLSTADLTPAEHDASRFLKEQLEDAVGP